MKKTSAFLGTLAVASHLIAAPAMADTSTTTTTTVAPRLVDKLILTYFGAYYGPSITNPTARTNDSGNGGQIDAGSTAQYLDSTITAGVRLTPSLNLVGNYRFHYRPMLLEGTKAKNFNNRDPWVSLIAPKLASVGGVNFWADLRFVFPLTTSDNIMGATRLTQITTFDVPKTRLSVGLFTFERANFLTDAGAAGQFENFSFNVSPFASYQLTSTLSATLWTDVIQASYSVVGADGGVPEGWSNANADICVGIGWDITPRINFNPMFIMYPASPTLDNTTINAQLSARIL
jgi:hypothetical protein